MARTLFSMPYFVLVRERGPAWDWSLPMRRQAQWEPHAAFMDALAERGFIVAGGPLGDEDTAKRVLHVIETAHASDVVACMNEDPWTPMHLLETVSLEPWSVLLGGFAPRR